MRAGDGLEEEKASVYLASRCVARLLRYSACGRNQTSGHSLGLFPEPQALCLSWKSVGAASSLELPHLASLVFLLIFVIPSGPGLFGGLRWSGGHV